jgi:hypothetical protein
MTAGIVTLPSAQCTASTGSRAGNAMLRGARCVASTHGHRAAQSDPYFDDPFVCKLREAYAAAAWNAAGEAPWADLKRIHGVYEAEYDAQHGGPGAARAAFDHLEARSPHWIPSIEAEIVMFEDSFGITTPERAREILWP